MPRRLQTDRSHATRSWVAGGEGDVHELTDRRRLVVALVLIAAFMIVEVVGAFLAHSLALLADAGHMLADAGAIAASLTAANLGLRPATTRMTYGYRRAEIIAATLNGITLVVVSSLVAIEAVIRLVRPLPVRAPLVVGVAGLGVVVNIVATFVLSGSRRRSLNVEGAFRHLLTDLYAFIATIVAGIVIWTTGFRRADAIASLIVVVLMLRAAVALLRPALRILVEATPDDVDLDELRRHIVELDEVDSVHDLHAWTLSSGLPIVSAHVVVSEQCVTSGQVDKVLDLLQSCLSDHFDVEHSTFQLEVPAHLDHEHRAHD